MHVVNFSIMYKPNILFERHIFWPVDIHWLWKTLILIAYHILHNMGEESKGRHILELKQTETNAHCYAYATYGQICVFEFK